MGKISRAKKEAKVAPADAEPAQAAPPELAALPPPGKAAKAPKAAKSSPPAGIPLALMALLLAAAAIGLQVLESPLAAMLLPLAAFVLALSAALPAKAWKVEPEAAKLRLVGFAFATLILLVVLAVVEGLALFAFTGLVFQFSDIAGIFVQAYPLLLGLFLLLGAGMRVAAGLWGGVLEVPKRRRSLAGALGGIALVVGILVAGAALQTATVIDLTVERAPFIAALAVMASLAALWAGSLPTFAQMGDWLARPGLRQQRLAKQLTKGFAQGAVAASLAGLALWLSIDATLGIAALTVGLLLALAAGFPSGVARYKPALGMDDPDIVLARFRERLPVLLVGSIGGFFLALLGLVAGLLLGDTDLGQIVSGAAIAGAAISQAALALLSPRIPVPGVLSASRRAAAFNLSLATLMLAIFGVLLGTGLAQARGIGAGLGFLLLLLAAMTAQGQNLVRVVLPPSRGTAGAKRAAKEKAKVEATTEEKITRTMHMVYAAGLGFTVLMTGLIAATSLGVVDVQQSIGVPTVAIIALVGLAGAPVVAYFVWKYLKVRNIEIELKQQAQAVYKKRLTPEEVSRLTIIGGSVTAAVVFMILGMLTQFKVLTALGPFELSPKYSTDFFVFAILVGLGPYGFMLQREAGRMRAIDAKFPEFLRDLAESKRAGMTLTQAVITASKGSYGALTPDIRKMAAQIEWGVSFSEALERFARRVKTPLIERSVSLIVQASEAGGNVVDILHAAAEDAREIQLLLRERKTAMSIYVMIIYISFFVFLAVIAILDAQFLPEVAKAVGGAKGVTVGPIKFGTIDIAAFEQVFFHAAIIQAIGGGFVAGVMEEGRPIGGLRHVFVMVIVGYIAFRFLIGG
ncbi:MAG TPA: type II secretion system F family protein [Candidatus Thermoplasmatota archaeon]|jgi:flagellar protein FlaJ|nr:type II secretion system F family protein [Candidatus Thermoplasmatota archaeon]